MQSVRHSGPPKRFAALAGVAALAFVLSDGPGRAGPCSAAIDDMQAKVDARIDAMAEAGPTGPETRDARLHHQPTPGSMAQAEARLDSDTSGVAAVAALKRAREADAAGDAGACTTALAEADRAIGP